MSCPSHAVLFAGYGAAAASSVNTTWINYYTDSVDRITYTFTVDTSTLAAGDHLLIGATLGDDGLDQYIVSVKVDTNLTIELVNTVTSSADIGASGFFLYEMPSTAATVSVVLVGAESGHSCAIGAWRVQDLGDTHPYDVNFLQASGGILATTTGSCPAGGALLAAVGCSNRTGPFTWTGLTEHADIDRESNDYSTWASADFATAQTNLTITATAGDTLQEANLTAVGLSPTPVTPWTPADLTGLEQWLRADLGVTGTTPVTAWADQSSNGRDMTEGTNGPLYVSSGVNSLPVLRFDGSNDILSCASVVIAQPFSVYLVIKWNAIASGSAPWAGNVASDTGPAFRTGSGPTEVYARSNNLNTTNGAPIVTTGFYVLKGVFNGTSSVVSLNQRRNEPNSNSLTGSTSSLRLGARNGAGFASCDIAECVIVNSPTTRDEAKLRFYFNQRYALWNQ